MGGGHKNLVESIKGGGNRGGKRGKEKGLETHYLRGEGRRCKGKGNLGKERYSHRGGGVDDKKEVMEGSTQEEAKGKNTNLRNSAFVRQLREKSVKEA